MVGNITYAKIIQIPAGGKVMNIEQWRTIKEFPDYAVSDKAKVKRVIKDKYNIGSNNPFAKLNEEQVLNIRKLYDNGWPITFLAKALGLKQPNVSLICSRKTWKHI